MLSSRRAGVVLFATLGGGTALFSISPGCYVVVVIAPPGLLFPDGSPWAEQPVCLEPSGFETVFATLA